MNVRLRLDLQIRMSSSEEYSLKVCLSKQHLLGIYVNWTLLLQMEYDEIENDSTVWTWIWRILEVKDWFSGISVATPNIFHRNSDRFAKGFWRCFWVVRKLFWHWKTFLTCSYNLWLIRNSWERWWRDFLLPNPNQILTRSEYFGK